jgi:hypothetical protein
MEKFTQDFLYEYIISMHQPHRLSKEAFAQAYMDNEEYLLKMLNHEESLNMLIDSKVNGIPLLFLIHHTYKDLISTFTVDNQNQYKSILKSRLENVLSALTDPFENTYEVYQCPENQEDWDGIYSSVSSKSSFFWGVDNDEPTVLDIKIPDEGYITRSFKAHLAILNILEENKEPVHYDNEYILANYQRVKKAHFFFTYRSEEVIDIYQYLLGKTDEQKIFAWNLIDNFSKNGIVISDTDSIEDQYKKITNNFGTAYQNNDDFTKCVSGMTHLNESRTQGTFPKELLPKLLPYVINNLHHYCSSYNTPLHDHEDEDQILATQFIVKNFIESCYDEKLLTQFKEHLDGFTQKYIKKCYDTSPESYELNSNEDAMLLRFLKVTNEQCLKLKLMKIPKNNEKSHKESINPKKRKLGFNQG